MPYDRIDQLPPSLRETMPERALEAYRRAFNRAWERSSDPDVRRGAATREEVAHRAAWEAAQREVAASDGRSFER